MTEPTRRFGPPPPEDPGSILDELPDELRKGPTTPKRLPVIYAVFDHEGLIIADGDKHPEKMLPGRIQERYVPAPATCATCKYWHLTHVGGASGDRWLCNHSVPNCPQDGSGYCHNHSDNATKASGG
jgi:hypothetical protein